MEGGLTTVVFESHFQLYERLKIFLPEIYTNEEIIDELDCWDEGGGEHFRVNQSFGEIEVKWVERLNFVPDVGWEVQWSQLNTIHENYLRANSEALNSFPAQTGGRGMVNIIIDLISEGFTITDIKLRPVLFDEEVDRLIPHAICKPTVELNNS